MTHLLPALVDFLSALTAPSRIPTLPFDVVNSWDSVWTRRTRPKKWIPASAWKRDRKIQAENGYGSDPESLQALARFKPMDSDPNRSSFEVQKLLIIRTRRNEQPNPKSTRYRNPNPVWSVPVSGSRGGNLQFRNSRAFTVIDTTLGKWKPVNAIPFEHWGGELVIEIGWFDNLVCSRFGHRVRAVGALNGSGQKCLRIWISSKRYFVWWDGRAFGLGSFRKPYPTDIYCSTNMAGFYVYNVKIIWNVRCFWIERQLVARSLMRK